MLLGFTVGNFRSFGKDACFSMEAYAKANLKYSIRRKTYYYRDEQNKKRRGTMKILPISAIYGAHSAGKSNLVYAMQYLRRAVCYGSINIDKEETAYTSPVIHYADALPNFNFQDKQEPIKLSVDFLVDNMSVIYSLAFFLNDKDTGSYVSEEELIVNDDTVFRRENNNIVEAAFKDAGTLDKARYGLTNTKLFLKNGYGVLYPQKAKPILEWFRFLFMPIHGLEPLQVYHDDLVDDKVINNVAEALGETNILEVKIRGKSAVTMSKIGGKTLAASLIESTGVKNMLYLYGAVATALQRGSTLILDECLDCFNSRVVMSLEGIFCTPEFNKNDAQLIFTTHNPICLNYELLRPDEIKFIDRDNDDGESEIYSLADFPAECQKSDDIMDNYFAGRYGAIEYVCLDEVFEPLLFEGV